MVGQELAHIEEIVFVLGLDLEGLFEVTRGEFGVSELEFGVTEEVVPGAGVFEWPPHGGQQPASPGVLARLDEIGGLGRKPSGCIQPRRGDLRIPGRQAMGAVEGSEGVCRFPGLELGRTQVAPSLPYAGFELDHLEETRNSRCGPALARLTHADGIVGWDQARLCRHDGG